MSVNFNTLYNDRSLEGEHLLTPFKHSVEKFGRSFKNWTDTYPSKFSGFMTRIADFIAGIFGMIGTSILVPFGMCMKYFSQPKRQEPEIDADKKDIEANTKLNGKVTEIKQAPKKTDSDVMDVKVVPKKSKPLFTTQVHKYPGDLSPAQIKECLLIDSNTLQLYFNENNLNFTIRNQNIFYSGAQVIVNAANTHLGGGGGIDGAIHYIGEDEYAEAHKQLKIKYNSNYTEGFASIISSGKLAEKYKIYNVIVVAGPQGDYTYTKAGQLYSCYYNSLALAHFAGFESIAFPSISTGEFSFPKEEAARIVLRAVYDFQKIFKGTLKTISVHFLSENSDFDFSFYKDALKTK